MSKYLKYEGDFCSIDGVKWRVEILQDSAEAFPLVGKLIFPADKPLEIEWKETDKLEPLQTSKATLTVVSKIDRQYIDMYTVEVGSTRMDVYRNDSLYWSGTLDTELYEEPYSFKNEYEVTLTFSDFAILDRLNFDKTIFLSIQEIIDYSLGKSGILYKEIKKYISTSLENKTTNTFLTDVAVNSENFYDEDGKPMSWREVLEEVLQPLALKMVQRNGQIIVYDLNNIYHNFDQQPVEWTGTDAVFGVDAIYNNVQINFSPYFNNSILTHEIEVDKLKETISEYWVMKLSADRNNSAQGFWLKLYDSLPHSSKMVIHPDARVYKIDPIFSGQEHTGIAWYIRKELNHNQGYTSILYNNQILLEDKVLMRINKRMPLPFRPVGEVSTGRVVRSYKIPEITQLKIEMDLMASIRYNPFEDDEDNGTASWKSNNHAPRALAVPFRLRIKDASGKVIKHYRNTEKREDGVRITNDKWVDGDYPDDISINPVLMYYNVDNIEEPYSCGWQTNNNTPVTLDSHKRFKLMGTGQFVVIPVNTVGELDFEVMKGLRYFAKRDISSRGSNIDLKYNVDTTKLIVNDLNWLLYKTPTISAVDTNGKTVDTKDVEYNSWLMREAKEDLKIDTICGTRNSIGQTGLGLYTHASTKMPIDSFERNGIQDCAECLLLGTVYSNYSQRMNVLSGTIKIAPDFGKFTDENEPGHYLLISEKQNLISDESEIKMVQFEPDNYEGIDYEEI